MTTATRKARAAQRRAARAQRRAARTGRPSDARAAIIRAAASFDLWEAAVTRALIPPTVPPEDER
jgi:hypothetical protein